MCAGAGRRTERRRKLDDDDDEVGSRGGSNRGRLRGRDEGNCWRESGKGEEW